MTAAANISLNSVSIQDVNTVYNMQPHIILTLANDMLTWLWKQCSVATVGAKLVSRNENQQTVRSVLSMLACVVGSGKSHVYTHNTTLTLLPTVAKLTVSLHTKCLFLTL